ncbi:MAG: hypothetical protein EBR26_03060, partial [Microbacteriaceae bacterium]|nr:hypothetical protein [Microbacteriaceae bacterium]
MLSDLNSLGAKARNLKILEEKYGLAVPFFKTLPFRSIFPNLEELSPSIEKEINSYLSGGNELETCTAAVSKLLEKLKIAGEVVTTTLQEFQTKGIKKVSFRTSALLEDGLHDSFAGQYESFLDLDITEDTFKQYALACFKSLVSVGVLSYAKARGIADYKLGGSLIVQEMFYGDYSGVLFSEDGTGKIQIAFSKSWRNQVVEGENAKELRVDKLAIDKANLPRQLRELCLSAVMIEDREGMPVDMEWAYNQQGVAYLQYRPITQPNLNYSFDWDSTNISENYPGITLPLTYSVIRQFYGAVYLAFFRMLGAKPKDIANAAPITENMLGYLDGRVYYRITNWYEAIKLMPGKRNQEYFEAMLNPVKKRGKAEKTKMDFRSIITIIRFASLLMRSESISRRFSEEIKQKIAQYDKINFDYLNAATILESGKRLRREVLEDWAVTILNDVRLMVFHGLLQRLFAKSDNPQDYLLLMQGLKDKASIKPLEKLTQLGQMVVSAMERERVSTVEDLEDTLSWSQLLIAANEYTEEFGARTPGELKLENERITDRIFTTLELARKSAKSGIDSSPDLEPRSPIWPSKQSKLLRPLIRYVAKQTRSAIDWRERFRFNRAQTFNLSRKAFDAVGKALASEGIISNPRDIYWLTDQEVEDFVGSHAPVMDAKELVSRRKEKFQEYEASTKTLAVTGSGRIAGMHQQNVLGDPG